MVKNPSCNTEDTSSIPGWGTKIPHGMWQLSLRTATTEPMSSGARVPQLESLRAATTEPVHSGAQASQLERSPRTTTEDPTCPN